MRSAEVRLQPNLGHKWPRELMPYYDWWVGVQEGRFTPGETLAFDWDETDVTPPETLPAALAPGRLGRESVEPVSPALGHATADHDLVHGLLCHIGTVRRPAAPVMYRRV